MRPSERGFWWSCRLWICQWPGSKSPFCALSVTVHFDDGGVDHGEFHVQLRPLGVSQYESFHPQLESQPSFGGNPESQQALGRSGRPRWARFGVGADGDLPAPDLRRCANRPIAHERATLMIQQLAKPVSIRSSAASQARPEIDMRLASRNTFIRSRNDSRSAVYSHIIRREYSLKKARVVIESWRPHNNAEPPHGSLAVRQSAGP